MNTSPTGIVAPSLPGARLRTDSTPWHRQFWPWFLIALPATSVVFSFATLYIAVSGADEVVPHEGDSTSYAAPREPGGTVGERAAVDGVAPPGPVAIGKQAATETIAAVLPGDGATGDDAAVSGAAEHATP